MMRDGLHNGDCLELLPTMPAGSIDMVLADLPYGTTRNRWDSVIPFAALWPLLRRACKPSAAIVLTASQPFTSALIMSNIEMFRHEWIWIKDKGSNFLNSAREPMKEHESVLVFSRGGWTYNKQMQQRSGKGTERVKTFVTSRSNSTNYGAMPLERRTMQPHERVPASWQRFAVERGLHPTQKPVPLFEYLIRTYSNPGELVLDCCAGSGTTAVAALNTNRRYICIEKDQDYYAAAKARIKAHATEMFLAA